ncbi:MAG: hypothetical protein V1912_01265 [bacterium]
MRPRLPLCIITTLMCLSAALLPASGCGTTATDGGVVGEVRIGPLRPVEQPGVENTAPYAADLVVKSVPQGKAVAEARSGDDGLFRIVLAPGDYLLEPENGDPLPRAEPQTFTVVRGRFTEVHVEYDSGIR